MTAGWGRGCEGLEREEIGRERDQDRVRSEQSGPVDRPEIRTDVDQHELGTDCSSGCSQHPMECCRDPQGSLVAIMATRPGF